MTAAPYAMDAGDTRYDTLAELRRYAFCVAGTVGLMACRVFGVTHAAASTHAAHLGIARQLTNVCRDVPEITPDTSQSRFTLVRLLDASGCDAVLGGRDAS